MAPISSATCDYEGVETWTRGIVSKMVCVCLAFPPSSLLAGRRVTPLTPHASLPAAGSSQWRAQRQHSEQRVEPSHEGARKPKESLFQPFARPKNNGSDVAKKPSFPMKKKGGACLSASQPSISAYAARIHEWGSREDDITRKSFGIFHAVVCFRPLHPYREI